MPWRPWSSIGLPSHGFPRSSSLSFPSPPARRSGSFNPLVTSRFCGWLRPREFGVVWWPSSLRPSSADLVLVRVGYIKIKWQVFNASSCVEPAVTATNLARSQADRSALAPPTAPREVAPRTVPPHLRGRLGRIGFPPAPRLPPRTAADPVGLGFGRVSWYPSPTRLPLRPAVAPQAKPIDTVGTGPT